MGLFGKPFRPDNEDDNEYDSFFDGPEAKLTREQWEAEQRTVKSIDNLLGSLTPEDASRPLFTFYERKIYNIRKYRK